jgi:hypothetical protein
MNQIPDFILVHFDDIMKEDETQFPLIGVIFICSNGCVVFYV